MGANEQIYERQRTTAGVILRNAVSFEIEPLIGSPIKVDWPACLLILVSDSLALGQQACTSTSDLVMWVPGIELRSSCLSYLFCSCIIYFIYFSFNFCCCCIFFWDRISCNSGWPQTLCVADTGFELLTLMPPPSKCWNYRHAPWCFGSLFMLL